MSAVPRENRPNTLLVVAAFCMIMFSFNSCSNDKEDAENFPSDKNYKQDMRDFVSNISSYAKTINPNFIIIPQNGVELLTSSGDVDGPIDVPYSNAIDGIGQEELNYGYDQDDRETPDSETAWIRTFLDLAKNNGAVTILVTDYCSTPSKMDNSYAVNSENNYISFAADHRELDNIPNHPSPIYKENANDITTLQQAKNFLYLINPDNEFETKQDFVDAVKNTNYDCIIMDLFYGNQEYSALQIQELQRKSNGGKRLLICYLSIGEAENYRYYWQSNWSGGTPSFIVRENPIWDGNYIVKYWEPEWQKIIFGNDSSYLKRIIDSGFHGAYLDIIDAFEYFEK